MTKKEYKKARNAIIDFKLTRVWMWLRLFFTLLAFVLSFAVAALSSLQKYTPLNFDAVIEAYLGGGAFMAFALLVVIPLGFISLVYYGAYSALGVSDIFGVDALSWNSFSNVGISLAVIGFFILGFILLVLSFKALKKTKKDAGGFLWLLFILTIENFVCIYRFGIEEILMGNNWALIVHLVNICLIILCARAIYCKMYLDKHFEKGAATKLREVKAMYYKGL